MNLNFGDFFKLTKTEKKFTSPNSGEKQHQSIGRLVGSGLNRTKGLNLVARSETENKHHHKKVTQCLNGGSGTVVPLTNGEAMDIIKFYNACPTETEKHKAIKQTGVYIIFVAPQKYTLMNKNK
jgi:hypothetical protein